MQNDKKNTNLKADDVEMLVIGRRYIKCNRDKYKKIRRHGEELLKRNTMQGQARGLARGSHHLIIFRLPVEKQILSVFCRFLSKDLQIAHQTLKMHQNKQK